MKEKIKAVFENKTAWVYAEQYDSVKIGKWNGEDLVFYEPIDEKYLILLRVFDKDRELKFIGDKIRDTEIYKNEDFIEELAHAKYYMYGEQYEICEHYTRLWENRGGSLYFPAVLQFPNDHPIGLMLGIKSFVRYNPIPVNGAINLSGAGALEVVDYAFTGFYYTDKKEVEL